MKVSSGDHQYMQRIGRYKSEAHQDAAAKHAKHTASERLERSWSLFISTRSLVKGRARIDNPSPFYERARRLGLSS